METPMRVDPAEINPAIATPEELGGLPDVGMGQMSRRRGAYVPWLLALFAVLGFGYLSSDRREAIGKFVAQVSDMVRDFRGYDPEV